MKLKPQKQLLALVALVILLTLGSVPALAAEKGIPSIQVSAVLAPDGSAVITEIWDVRGVSGGTEYYKALNHMEGMRVHSLMVWDESGTPYQTLDSWNTGLTLSEKAGTCGILNTSDGYELCWGIGSYGDHRYTIQYNIEGLVKDYGDYAGFYHQFISELSSAPGSAEVQIRLADARLTEGDARIWGYGFPGEVEIGGDGVLRAFSTHALGRRDYVNVLCRFEKDLFPAAAKAGISFEKLQGSAEGRGSGTGATVAALLGGSIAVAALLAGFMAMLFLSRCKLADGTVVKFPKRKEIKASRSIPFHGSIPAVYSAMSLLRRGIACQRLMGAYLIRWQEARYIRIEKRGVGAKKQEEVVVFSSRTAPLQGAERTLYQILIGGADRDGVLWTSAIEESAEALYKELTAWANEVQEDGRRELIASGMAAMDGKGAVRLTAAGFQQALSALGLQKYLAELGVPRGDAPPPTELWGNYLVFAALFGTGEQVLAHMKALDPAYFDTFSGLYGCNAYTMMYFMTMTNHISNAYTPSTDGMGGVAGSIGGGGFSGGGGGGSR